MKKTYTKKQITEAIAYWQKKLEEMNESKYFSGVVKINVYDVNFADGGTETDVVQQKYRNVQFGVDINKNLANQIENWFYDNAGIIPISYKFKTVDAVRCKNYDKLDSYPV